MSELILQLEQVTKSFGESKVLDGIDLCVYSGEFITLLGSSGCGKTTTLRIISGLETPDSGRVLLEGSADYPQFRQVMVDEAQDYGPLHFLLLRKWFPRAEFTVLGDVQQSLAEDKKLDFYEQVAESLGLPGSPLAVLKETYRSTAEISAFCRRLAADPSLLLPFDRRGPEPALLQAADRAGMVELLTGQVKAYREEGLGSIAIITKTGAEAEALYRDLAGQE